MDHAVTGGYQGPLRPQGHGHAGGSLPPQGQGRLPGAALPGQQLRLLIRQLDQVRLAGQAAHLLLRRFLGGPQAGPVIGVVGDDSPGIPGYVHRRHGGAADRLPGHGQGTDVQHPGVPQALTVQLLLAQTGVRPGLPGKGKAPLASRVQGHEGQGGEHLRVRYQAPDVDAGGHQGVPQEIPVHIRPHLPQKGRLMAEPGQGRQHVGRCATGIALKQLHPRRGQAAVGEVDEQLPQGRHVKPPGHSAASGYSLHSRR